MAACTALMSLINNWASYQHEPNDTRKYMNTTEILNKNIALLREAQAAIVITDSR